MKIEPTKTTQIGKCSIVRRIKNFFLSKNTKLQNLEKDVFEKATNAGVEKMPKKQIYPRKLPNCVSGPDEYDHIIPGGGGYVRYYPEDLEKMKNMTEDEIFEFKKNLRRQKRFYLDENPTN